MMLCGAELGRDKAINQFEMQSKYRILPKQFGKYCGKKVFEIEKVLNVPQPDTLSYLTADGNTIYLKKVMPDLF